MVELDPVPMSVLTLTVLIACLSPVAGVNLPVFEHYTDGSDSKFLILHAVAFAAAVSTSHCKTVLTVIKENAKKCPCDKFNELCKEIS